MLLTCCFRDQSSTKKGSRRKKHDEENSTLPLKKVPVPLCIFPAEKGVRRKKT
jgi:hypothetical protein